MLIHLIMLVVVICVFLLVQAFFIWDSHSDGFAINFRDDSAQVYIGVHLVIIIIFAMSITGFYSNKMRNNKIEYMEQIERARTDGEMSVARGEVVWQIETQSDGTSDWVRSEPSSPSK